MGAWVSPILNPPPHLSPPHPSELSQSIGFGCPAPCIKLALVIYFTYGNARVSVLFCQIIAPLHSPRVQKPILYICVSFAALHIGLSLPFILFSLIYFWACLISNNLYLPPSHTYIVSAFSPLVTTSLFSVTVSPLFLLCSPVLCIFQISHISDIIQCLFFFVWHFTKHDVLQVHPCGCKWQHFIHFYGWGVFHCVLLIDCCWTVRRRDSWPLEETNSIWGQRWGSWTSFLYLSTGQNIIYIM